MRILLDHNVPVGVREFLCQHEVRTVTEMHWPPQIANGELLKAAEQAGAEQAGLEVLLTSDQNIQYPQDLSRRNPAFVILGSNIWPIVRNHRAAIADAVQQVTPGSCRLAEMELPKKPQRVHGNNEKIG